MIDKNKVVKLVKEKLDEGMFLVDVLVTKNNSIQVFVDGFDGVTIEKCVEISRNIEHNLNRDKEDFELQVSSPGLTERFKVPEQYQKYKLKEVEVKTKEDIKLTGILKDVNPDSLVIETSVRKKVEGHKKKQLIKKQHILKFKEIQSTKPVISFK
jgi:ribosome maturation factor RimP